MQQVNALRAILVAGAVVAAVIAAAIGVWTAAVVLTAGVIGHALLWRYLGRLDATATVEPPTP